MAPTPTGLIVALKFVCRGGVSPPDFFRVVEGGPFVWRNVTFGSLREGAPAQAGGGACETKGGALVLK